MEEERHTKAFPLDGSAVFFGALSFAFFTVLTPDPTAGRHNTAYTVCIIANGRIDCRSMGTGSATRAGKPK